MVKPKKSPAAAPTSKQQLVRQMLGRNRGVTLAELAAATGWQPHSTRAALTGLRKSGLTITKEKQDGVTRYRTEEAA